MKLRKSRLEESRLYVIVDKRTSGRRSIFNIAKKAKDAGAGIIQLRDKDSKREDVLSAAYKIRKLLSKSKTLFIVNDYLDIAKIVDSDGIHLGQGDVPPQVARQILGKDKIIGISCHNLSQALIAQSNGADYVSIGPIFPTPTKPEYKSVGLNLIRKVKGAMRIPFFVIGDINERNVTEVLSFGAKRIAVCRPVCKAKNIPLAIKRLNKAMMLE